MKAMKKKERKKREKKQITYGIGLISVESYYGYQELRKALMNRLRDIIRRKNEGISFDRPEDKKEDKDYQKKYADGKLPGTLKHLLKEKKISVDEFKYISKLIAIGNSTKNTEKQYGNMMGSFVKGEEIWKQWLCHIRGIGPVLAANLLKFYDYCEVIIKDKETGEVIGKESGDEAEFKKAWALHQQNPERYFQVGYEDISSLWRHSGLDPDGAKGRVKGQKIHYDPKRKTFAWNLADSLQKQRSPVYREHYDSYKNHQLHLMKTCKCLNCGQGPQTHTKKEKAYHCEGGGLWKPSNPLAPMSLDHAHKRALRKMVKLFLQHYWLVARTIKGLPTREPYAIGKLGHQHYIKPPFWNPPQKS